MEPQIEINTGSVEPKTNSVRSSYFFRLKELKSITLAQMLPKTGYKIAHSASIPFYQGVCERD